MATCTICHKGKFKQISCGCACTVHKKCRFAFVERALLQDTLTCPICNIPQRMPSVQLTQILRKKIRLFHPMFYGRQGLIPHVSREYLGDGDAAEYLKKYQRVWIKAVDDVIQTSPTWLHAKLKQVKKRQVTLCTTMTKWD